MKIFNTSIIKQLDAYTIEHEPISSVDLMERAASAITFEIIARWKRNTRIVVFAGAGNNGGDALAVARMLIEEGYKLEVYLFNPLQKLSADCARNKERLSAFDNILFSEVKGGDFVPPQLFADTLVIDGLFGSGLKVPLTGGFAAVVQYINDSEATVVSIDIPSGLFGEDNAGNNRRYIVKANLTLTLQFPKFSFFFAENERFTGEWKILDIGLHPDGMEQTATNLFYTEIDDACALLKSRNRFTDKRDVGHALLMAGSHGMTGAAVLAAKAAMHSGAGLLTVHTPAGSCSIIQQSVPEALVSVDENELHVSKITMQHSYAAIAAGPGLGRHQQTIAALDQLIGQIRRPCVIDADALNIIAEHMEWLSRIPANSIFTPHVKEFDRLFGKCDTGIERISKALEVAKRYNIIIVLKGANTAVVLPKGEIHFNSTGNPGMATAGSGDALTGLLLGLLAQGYAPRDAAILGVYLHGLAGDLAAEAECEEYIIAGDIIAHIGKAFKKLKFYKQSVFS